MSQPNETITPIADTTATGHARQAVLPTARQWALHALLFVVTAMTTTICGIMMAVPDVDAGPGTAGATGLIGSLLLIPRYYVGAIVELLVMRSRIPFSWDRG